MNKDEYIVQPNELGGYDLILGSDGVDTQTITDLINELKVKSIIPVEAKVITYIYGVTYMSHFKDSAKKFTDERLNSSLSSLDNSNDRQSEFFYDEGITLEKPKVKIKTY